MLPLALLKSFVPLRARGWMSALRRPVRLIRRPVRVAIIGCGDIAKTHVQAYELSGLARVVAVADRRVAPLARALDRWPFVQAYQDYRQMLHEIRPQVISVCTWPQSHAEIVMAAAQAGVRGILCEKPLALQMRDINEMIGICRDHHARLAGGHQYRFHPCFVRARRLVAAGLLGRLRQARGQIAGTLADNGSHLVDAVRFLLGDPRARSVSCRCVRKQDRIYQDFPSEDSAAGEIAFDDGVRFEFQAGDQARAFFEITLTGTARSLVVNREGIRLIPEVAEVAEVSETADFRSTQFREFIRWVNGRIDTYPANADNSKAAAELVLAAYESARLDVPVELPLENTGDVIHALYESADSSRSPGSARPRSTRGADPGPPQERLAMNGGPRMVREWFSGDPCVGASEIRGLARVIRSRKLNCTYGREVRTFQEEFARLYGSPRAVASTSGTAAIHCALGALNPDPCSEVITTPVTDMGTIIPILACNCVPVFADVDPRTGNLTAASIARKITPRTRAVIVVHLFGRPAELEPIVRLLAERRIPLIEDCSQAHFARYRGQFVGSFGDFGCFSLQQSKQITCGDGGVTLVNRPEHAERAALFVDKGWGREFGRRHLFLGMNYRMTELQAAVIRAQLRKLPAFITRRRRAADKLSRRLRSIPGMVLPAYSAEISPAWWVYHFGIDERRLGVTTDDFCDALLAEGVQVLRHYLPGPVFQYEVLKNQITYGSSQYPFSGVAGYTPPDVADYPGFTEFHRRQLCIMWTNRVRVRHAEAIADAVRKVVNYYRAARVETPEFSTIQAPARGAELVEAR